MKNPLNYLCIFALLIFGQALPGIVIRPATPDEVPKVMELSKAVCLEYYGPIYEEHYPDYFPNGYPEKLEVCLAKFEPIFLCAAQGDENHRLLVAADGDQIVGTILFCKLLNNPSINICWICVRKDHRRQGIGKVLIRQAMGQWPGQIASCQAKVLRDNPKVSEPKTRNGPTRAFYEQVGFTLHGKVESDEPDGYGMPWGAGHDFYVYTIAQVK